MNSASRLNVMLLLQVAPQGQEQDPESHCTVLTMSGFQFSTVSGTGVFFDVFPQSILAQLQSHAPRSSSHAVSMVIASSWRQLDGGVLGLVVLGHLDLQLCLETTKTHNQRLEARLETSETYNQWLEARLAGACPRRRWWHRRGLIHGRHTSRIDVIGDFFYQQVFYQ